MADALETVRASLLAASPALGVGTRVYPNLRPQNDTLPNIVLSVVSTVPEWDLAGDANLDQVRVQVDYYAATYAAVVSLAAAGRAAVAAGDVILISELRDVDTATNPETYRVTQDYYVWISPA